MKSKGIQQRYIICSSVSLITSILLGVLIGLFRHHISDTSAMLIIVGIWNAFLFRKVGNSIQFRFALSAVLYTLLAILISDVIHAYDLAGLIQIDLIISTFAYSVAYDIESVVWLAYRGLSLYIAYTYSRVV